MSETDSKAATKGAKGDATKKRKAKPVEPTAASSRPSRTHRKPNRFDFGDEKAVTIGSKRKRAASKERTPTKKRRSVSKSPSRSSKKSSSKKAKKEKDPDAPKKPLSAYMLFAQANRDKVKKEHPDASFGDTGKILGKMWSKASSSEKAKFEKQAEKEKEKYEKEVAKYKKSKKSEDESESD